MATKNKVVEKKLVVAKASKAVVTKVPKEKKVNAPKSSVELVSFGVKATIPVMTFGNIQPEIVVKAKTIDEAIAFAMPVIDNLFDTYVEAPRDGSPKSKFSKANVTVTEKQVAPSSPGAPTPVQKAPVALTPVAPVSVPVQTAEQTKAFDDEPETPVAKSAAYERGEKAIGAAMSSAALDLIEDQIKNSVKLSAEEKPFLFTLLLKKRKEFN